MRFKFFFTNIALLKHSFSSILLIISFSIICCQGKVYAADQWDKTDPAGTESPSDLDTLIITNNNVVDRLLADYQEGVKIVYASASTITVEIGQIVCDNSGRSLRKWRENTSSTTVTWSDLDTGAETSSTTYYLYAVADTDVATFTVTISTSSSAPSGKTYYARLGSFYNDSSSNIEQIANDNHSIIVATGTVVHGGAIPLPSGYTESQCRWIVSINNLITGEDAISGVERVTSSINSTTRTSIVCSSNSPQWGTNTGTANYIIIGYK